MSDELNQEKSKTEDNGAKLIDDVVVTDMEAFLERAKLEHEAAEKFGVSKIATWDGFKEVKKKRKSRPLMKSSPEAKAVESPPCGISGPNF